MNIAVLHPVNNVLYFKWEWKCCQTNDKKEFIILSQFTSSTAFYSYNLNIDKERLGIQLPPDIGVRTLIIWGGGGAETICPNRFARMFS